TVHKVVPYNSPRQVTSLLQRVGRSGHKLDRTSRGLILAVSSDDAIESLASVQAAQEGDLEPLHLHRLALDVLAHQIVGCALDQGGTAPWSEILTTIRAAEPYRELEDATADRVAEFLDHLGVLRQQGDKVRVTPKGRRYYFENLSTIRDERRYQVMDLTTQKQVGILGEEFMMIQAREGLHFIVRGRPWKIERIGKDGMVYVTPVADPNDMIEELLARKHLVRFWWTDPYRILYELVADTREIDVEALVDDLLRIDDETLEGGLKALLENHLPLGYYMKGIAERFGAIRRGLTVGEGDLRSLEIRFANTP